MPEQLNWRDLLAGPELDELICRKVGWFVTSDVQTKTATLWSPEGKAVNTWGSSEAWPNVVNIAWYNAPRYSRDAEAALQLFAALSDDCTPRVVRTLSPQGDHIEHAWKAGIILHGDDLKYLENIEEDAETPALAICRAWLAWSDPR